MHDGGSERGTYQRAKCLDHLRIFTEGEIIHVYKTRSSYLNTRIGDTAPARK